MHNHTLLGFDFGLRRIGLAVGQSSLQIATALKTLSAKDGIPEWDEIQTLTDEWNASEFVVGIPYSLGGGVQEITRAAKQFAESLRQRFNLPVYETDERLSTVEARSQIYAKGNYKTL
ncbi:MAG: Holliday junction resolvase RuvX, partial [Gammaproteobacteria bacterium]